MASKDHYGRIHDMDGCPASSQESARLETPSYICDEYHRKWAQQVWVTVNQLNFATVKLHVFGHFGVILGNFPYTIDAWPRILRNLIAFEILLRMWCSIYWYMPTIKSSPTGYPGVTYTFPHSIVYMLISTCVRFFHNWMKVKLHHIL